jgi:hypothetical protein
MMKHERLTIASAILPLGADLARRSQLTSYDS